MIASNAGDFLCYILFFFKYIYVWNNFWQRGSVHSYVPAVLGTQLCGSRPSYWEQTSPAGLNTCTEALENVVKPYLDTRLADSDKQFFILQHCWMLAKPHLPGPNVQLVSKNSKKNDNWQLRMQNIQRYIIHLHVQLKIYWLAILG